MDMQILAADHHRSLSQRRPDLLLVKAVDLPNIRDRHLFAIINLNTMIFHIAPPSDFKVFGGRIHLPDVWLLIAESVPLIAKSAAADCLNAFS